MAPVIKLNGETIEIDCSEMSNLSGIAEKVAESFFAPKEVVTELYVNDILVKEGAVASTGETPISEIRTVSFNTVKDPAEKVVELLKKMGAYLDGFSAGVGKVADQFRMGSPEEANRILVQAIEGVGSFTELLSAVRLVTGSGLSDLSYENKSLGEREERLLEITKKMQASQEEKDWITVADLLEYELGPLMTEWKEMIPLLENEVLKSI
ncbi:hypothetical protein MNBD_NITROSPINAE03-295 [hydrothermal vent metagenome]|uniref:DUF8042 domain-containing protein n=1 Tax=hydrothermal vent metagenome TaxID=652676 RepID=A0A3B1CIR3_9ZZZZ